MFTSKSIALSRQLISSYAHSNASAFAAFASHINAAPRSAAYSTETEGADSKKTNAAKSASIIANIASAGNVTSTPSAFSKQSTPAGTSSFGTTSFGDLNISTEKEGEGSVLKPKRAINTTVTESDRVRQIRRRVALYTQMLAQQPKTVTINFTERRTNTFCTIFAGKEPKMNLVSGFSVGQLLKVGKRARRTPQNTKIFVESIMRRRLPRIMAGTNSTVINVRIKGTRKVAKPLIAELRTILQDQMKEVRETGSLSHPLWTVGSIKNITPYDMGSHKKRKRWRHL